MNATIWTAAVAALLVSAGATADPIYEDYTANLSGPATAATAAASHPTDKAAMKAAKRAAKAEKKAAKRLAKQCRKELKRAAKRGTQVSAACRAPAETTLANASVVVPESMGPEMGNALGQTATSQGQGTQGNGNAYGMGQSQAGGTVSSMVTSLPPAAYQPTNGPVVLSETSLSAPVVVPEPATLALFGLGLLGLGAAGRRRSSRSL